MAPPTSSGKIKSNTIRIIKDQNIPLPNRGPETEKGVLQSSQIQISRLR